jgi:hypothetical protein
MAAGLGARGAGRLPRLPVRTSVCGPVCSLVCGTLWRGVFSGSSLRPRLGRRQRGGSGGGGCEQAASGAAGAHPGRPRCVQRRSQGGRPALLGAGGHHGGAAHAAQTHTGAWQAASSGQLSPRTCVCCCCCTHMHTLSSPTPLVLAPWGRALLGTCRGLLAAPDTSPPGPVPAAKRHSVVFVCVYPFASHECRCCCLLGTP